MPCSDGGEMKVPMTQEGEAALREELQGLKGRRHEISQEIAGPGSSAISRKTPNTTPPASARGSTRRASGTSRTSSPAPRSSTSPGCRATARCCSGLWVQIAPRRAATTRWCASSAATRPTPKRPDLGALAGRPGADRARGRRSDRGQAARGRAAAQDHPDPLSGPPEAAVARTRGKSSGSKSWRARRARDGYARQARGAGPCARGRSSS